MVLETGFPSFGLKRKEPIIIHMHEEIMQVFITK